MADELGVGGLQVYVHSKVMIADDNIAVVGSANVNDRCGEHIAVPFCAHLVCACRSMCGSRDSEICAVICGGPASKGYMNKEPVMVSEAVQSFRMRLWHEHLGE